MGSFSETYNDPPAPWQKSKGIRMEGIPRIFLHFPSHSLRPSHRPTYKRFAQLGHIWLLTDRGNFYQQSFLHQVSCAARYPNIILTGMRFGGTWWRKHVTSWSKILPAETRSVIRPLLGAWELIQNGRTLENTKTFTISIHLKGDSIETFTIFCLNSRGFLMCWNVSILA